MEGVHENTEIETLQRLPRHSRRLPPSFPSPSSVIPVALLRHSRRPPPSFPSPSPVIPAQAGIQSSWAVGGLHASFWIPACAGMTFYPARRSPGRSNACSTSCGAALGGQRGEPYHTSRSFLRPVPACLA